MAHDNMLSFDDYLPDGVMGRMEDGLGTMEGSDNVRPSVPHSLYACHHVWESHACATPPVHCC